MHLQLRKTLKHSMSVRYTRLHVGPYQLYVLHVHVCISLSVLSSSQLQVNKLAICNTINILLSSINKRTVGLCIHTTLLTCHGQTDGQTDGQNWSTCSISGMKMIPPPSGKPPRPRRAYQALQKWGIGIFLRLFEFFLGTGIGKKQESPGPRGWLAGPWALLLEIPIG